MAQELLTIPAIGPRLASAHSEVGAVACMYLRGKEVSHDNSGDNDKAETIQAR